ncbi:MAG: thioredoxin [Gammaproteobacteria bacterium]|nr:thioredoxin [Gammaproteobacteria bacterium]
MSESPYIFSVTQSDFEDKVLATSHRVPVLVDYWAAWCGPCQMLTPVLAKLADAYQGKFLLVKINTDEQQRLALEHGIRSLPTLRVFKDGEVVDEMLGVQPEGTLRAMLDRYIARESDQRRTTALEARRRGDIERALNLLNQAAQADPDNHRVRLDLADLLMERGALDQAEEILRALPVTVQEEQEVKVLLARLEFMRIARDAPDAATLERALAGDPANCEVRHQLGARRVLAGDYENAMGQFLEIVRRDRNYRDGAGRKSLLAVFDVLGGKGELVNRYRSLMFNALH